MISTKYPSQAMSPSPHCQSCVTPGMSHPSSVWAVCSQSSTEAWCWRPQLGVDDVPLVESECEGLNGLHPSQFLSQSSNPQGHGFETVPLSEEARKTRVLSDSESKKSPHHNPTQPGPGSILQSHEEYISVIGKTPSLFPKGL